VSLRLLPKLFGSFQQFRGMDTQQVTMWAEHEHHMMAHFFSNLVAYVANGPRCPALHSHQTEVQVRLQFLTSIYSTAGSPDSFR
jgi:ubiquitin carboxyl-terminal hydrolase 34